MAEMPETLSGMEQRLRQSLLRIGQFVLSAWVSLAEEEYPQPTLTCRCGEETAYQFQHEGVLRTVVGTVHYERAYYLCPHCHTGTYPLDERLGLRAGELSAEMESLTAMMGAAMAFGKGSALFEQLTLLGVSPQVWPSDSSHRSRNHNLEEEWMEQSQDLAVADTTMSQEPQKDRLYGAIDAFKVHTDQKRDETDQGWRDLKIGAWFRTEATPPAHPDGRWDVQARDITYYCDIAQAHDFGHLVWATGFKRQPMPTKN